MDFSATANTMLALSHPTRLRVLRTLAGKSDGMPAGEIAGLLAVDANNMSAHLKVLAQARLIGSRREGRFILYTRDDQAVGKALSEAARVIDI